MLEGVIIRGTAKNLATAIYKIAGKTGTVQIANDKYGYKYDGKYSYQASFVGYFPADNPKYSCIVVVNAPSNDVYYGNQVAGPIFKEIADKVYASSFEMHPDLAENPPSLSEKNQGVWTSLPYSKYGDQRDLQTIFNALDISTTSQNENTRWVVTLPQDSCVTLLVRRIEEELKNGFIPNVVGMGIQDAIYLLENAGLQVKIIGSGMIVKQSLNPGDSIIKGDEIILELS